MHTHDTFEDLIDAEHGDILMMVAEGRWWLAWETEDGDWYAIRPRDEDDKAGPDGDVVRPIGPALIEDQVEFPIRVVSMGEVDTLTEQLAAAQAEAKDLRERNAGLGWMVNPDRMGQ